MSGESSLTDTGENNFLIKPERKKNCNASSHYPLPIARDDCDSNEPFRSVIGYLKGNCVEVSNPVDVEFLFNQGFFGKGTLSRSTPQVVEKKFKKRGSSAKIKKQSEQRENDSFNSETEAVSSTKKEVLQLSHEEAYFLSYGFGVLVVKDEDEPLDLKRLWHKFCEIHPQKFPIMYTAYHHFRSKGWIVRSGIKYGCDFVLYKDGPPFYHSTYAVIVNPVKERNFHEISVGGRPNLTWSSLAAVHRICSHSSKGVLILYVIQPDSMSENELSTPDCISQFQVEEVLVNRWVPSEGQKCHS